MRIFKSIFIICIGWAQGQDIHFQTLNQNSINDSLFVLLKKENDLSIEYHLKSFSIKPSQSIYGMTNGQKVADSLIILGLENIHPLTANRLWYPFRDSPIGDEFSTIGNSISNRYYFLNQSPQIQYGLINPEKLGIVIQYQPNFQSHFSGLFGMSQNNESWDVTGEMDFHLENLIRTAGIIDLKWKRVDSLSQLIKFKIMEPHPFGWDIGTDFSYHHELIGGQYTFLEKRALLQVYMPWAFQWNVGITSGTTRPTEKGVKNGYKKIGFKAFALSLSRDSRNKRLLPNSGQYFYAAMDLGLQSESGFMKRSLEYQYYHQLNSKLHGEIKFVEKGIYDFKTLVPKSRYFFYGGASSLRGYKEQIFSSPHFQIATLELGFQPSSKIEGTLFLDIASETYFKSTPFKIGYGIGLTQINDNTVIQVQYALSNNGNFKGGKLHIKWVSRL